MYYVLLISCLNDYVDYANPELLCVWERVCVCSCVRVLYLLCSDRWGNYLSLLFIYLNCLQKVSIHTFVLTTAIYYSTVFIGLFIGLFITEFIYHFALSCKAVGSCFWRWDCCKLSFLHKMSINHSEGLSEYSLLWCSDFRPVEPRLRPQSLCLGLLYRFILMQAKHCTEEQRLSVISLLFCSMSPRYSPVCLGPHHVSVPYNLYSIVNKLAIQSGITLSLPYHWSSLMSLAVLHFQCNQT